ncbi:MAG: NepR family anti-sigma factor [Parasphingopyxis sp.]|uniref:NepR family anti-sigma factor n=1 Tax=Parasphingopyxis sp. TaxID=1920299 RepID=UPI003FA0C68D
MSDNSPLKDAAARDAAEGHLHLGFPMKNRTRVGACLRDAFDHVADEDVPDELEQLLRQLN